MKNRNTTVAGVGAIMVAVGSILTALFDGDQTTVPDYASGVAAIIAGVGLILARDAKEPKDDAP